ncbi:flavin reductase family protein [Salinivibrio sp. ES.052]|uniref:flavin reductase family protein n=1 Tax=Salinivibrio sp. ES.052 TaxID=1882823 RepID=UPI00092702A8|nr:flavin reductase [Salinivibrio sp. ES.052]SIO25782.1 NADH-FMN oxidoreductase RutF, flavin reductase (DIM6/NTAB) family [Salinivibrio sp. ES.052]
MSLSVYERDDILAMEKRYRAAFVNSLSGFKSANLLGTSDTSRQTNLCMVSSAFHLGSDPALMGIIIRPDVVPRDSLDNIRETGVYTLNHVQEAMVSAAHQTSARYPRGVSEFEQVGFTPLWRERINAPYVQEAAIRLGLILREEHTMAINGTHLLVGEIIEAHIPDCCIGKDGFIDIEQAGTVALSGLDSYHTTKSVGRLSYAKPDTMPEWLD